MRATAPFSLRIPQEKLDKSLYTSPKEFKHDVNLVWNNCMTYNAVRGWWRGSPDRRVHEQAVGAC